MESVSLSGSTLKSPQITARSSDPPPEPTALVDALNDELGIDTLTKARLKRQAERNRDAVEQAAA